MSNGVKADSIHRNTHGEGAGQGIHVVVKPIGPVCNLHCEYCFYLEKQAFFGSGSG